MSPTVPLSASIMSTQVKCEVKVTSLDRSATRWRSRYLACLRSVHAPPRSAPAPLDEDCVPDSPWMISTLGL